MADRAHIASLLSPFLNGAELSDTQLGRVQTYLDLLLRWNARMNLTSVRDPDQIVTRHFGESFFTARHIAQRFTCSLPASTVYNEPPASPSAVDRRAQSDTRPATGDCRLADIGSGAGFPGLPIKIMLPQITLTLIESQYRKAIFLREVIRALELEHAEVFAGRAEDFPSSADVVTLRAVERFSDLLPVAVHLLAGPGSLLCLLIGAAQVETAGGVLPQIRWDEPVPLPQSESRVLLIGAVPALGAH